MKLLKFIFRILLDIFNVNKNIKIYIDAEKYSLLDLIYISNYLSIKKIKFVEIEIIKSDFNFLYNVQLIDILYLFQIDYNLNLVDEKNHKFKKISMFTKKKGIYLNLNIKKTNLNFNLNTFYLKWAHNYLKNSYPKKLCIVCDTKPKSKKKDFEYIEINFFGNHNKNLNLNMMQKFSILKNSDGYYGKNKTIILFCKANNIDVLNMI